MADDEKRERNQKKKANGSTQGGRSSGQGVKLRCIRDVLYARAIPKRQLHTGFLGAKNIEAATKSN